MLDGGVGGDGGAVEDMRDGIGRIGLGAEFEQAGDDGADESWACWHACAQPSVRRGVMQHEIREGADVYSDHIHIAPLHLRGGCWRSPAAANLKH
jgi:hypothetical protein